ncbi:hypothetical protein QOT17_004757 [Balamuthia mandrillaris]
MKTITKTLQNITTTRSFHILADAASFNSNHPSEPPCPSFVELHLKRDGSVSGRAEYPANIRRKVKSGSWQEDGGNLTISFTITPNKGHPKVVYSSVEGHYTCDTRSGQHPLAVQARGVDLDGDYFSD